MVMKKVGSKVKLKAVAKPAPKPRLRVKVDAPIQTPPHVSRSVYDLLKESMEFHNRAKSRGAAGRPPGWFEDLKQAARLRQEALRADPSRSQACWVDFGNHEALTGFYFDKGAVSHG